MFFIYSIDFQPILGSMAHNVPAVYDVFAVAIKEREAFQQLQKCGCSEAWERNVTRPEPL
jgi:hypothetical protein